MNFTDLFLPTNNTSKQENIEFFENALRAKLKQFEGQKNTPAVHHEVKRQAEVLMREFVNAGALSHTVNVETTGEKGEMTVVFVVPKENSRPNEDS